MTNPMLTIHNVETGEIIERPMTAAEEAAFDASATAYADKEAAKLQAEVDKAALLIKLGITADEAALLLG
jgi:hypothetical protein